MSTSVSSVVSHFPSPQNGFTTTTSGSVASGATTVGLNSVAGYSNGQIAAFVIDPSDSTKKQTFTGVIDTAGVQVTSVVWTAGSNTTHASGATVVDYATATHIAMITKGLLVEHGQAGTHSTTLITSRTEDTSPASGDFLLTYDTSATALKKVQPTNLMAIAGLVVPNSLVSGAGTSWAWQSWSPTWTNMTVGNGTVVENKYTQVGKTVIARYRFTFGSGSSMGTSPTFTLPVTAGTYSVLSFSSPIGQLTILDSGTVVNNGIVTMESTTTAGLQVFGSAAAYVNQTGLSSTVPMTWTTNDSFSFQIVYEAA